ncbi:tRNA (uridine(54)-C5)-methyltransferase TrmA [Helicobacter sp. 11S03491-1]|uniref:tRNA (uridine(54)-C5)-methyltransferase TrmA n=1 Tax=Helicobacter sp. 11S03491-1 TaxID=1476196 RepID=UPI000BA719FF|nr:tRNA (uridine(54)-C5)-methyltransferase TrmA [Helicobacter sp. 11S03491-1]PAF42053.1 tRNA (uridine(54)-C5)-methyltransferase TrmA [Helicobacter sp. 11S03491-1]
MICENFLECGGCQIDQDYHVQFSQKFQIFQSLFEHKIQDLEIFYSPPTGFRARGEFRLHRENSKVYLSMNTYGKNNRVKISSCPILLPILQEKLEILLAFINTDHLLEHKLYGIKILGGLSGDSVITLIYHKKLDNLWEESATRLSQDMRCSLIGRSRGQKIIIGKDYIRESLWIGQQNYFYIHQESGFSQPNPYTNIQMIEFVLSKLPPAFQSDMLEMYCGSGNFTIPLAKRFQKVFATEVVKSSIQTLKINAVNNNVQNIIASRLSGLETLEALSYKRDFFRLRKVCLEDFNFSHIFLDPPRSGIKDPQMLAFIQKFKHIIYISCNPFSLKQDFATLLQTHRIKHSALFDQFPYTHHLECGFMLERF